MTLDTKPHTMPGTSLSSPVKGYLLTHRSEGSSPHTVAYYKGILRRFLWYAEQEKWPDDARLLNQWQILLQSPHRLLKRGLARRASSLIAP